MKEQTVSILAGWGGSFGAGHVQRMACLADYLTRARGIRTVITGGTPPLFLPASLQDLFVPEIIPGSSCIIRDRRDSDIEEIRLLKASGPVITIDDCGPGRKHADTAIDLLPNLSFSIHKKDTFIYGYNFVDSIRSLGNRRIEKTIDIALYCGLDTARDYVRLLLSFLPDGATTAVLAGKDSYMITNGKILPLDLAFAESVASAKVLISHFGITLYEGLAAGCRLVCVNPTSYHSDLADRARDEIDLLNLGITKKINPEQARSIIFTAVREGSGTSIDTGEITLTIEGCLNNFYARISPCLVS